MMGIEKKISIVVPVYKAEKYLEECLQSIASQSYTNFEVLLVYTPSYDQTLNICRYFAAKDKRFFIIENNTGMLGVSHARNLGLNEARGQYLGFVDSDDVVASDMFTLLIGGLQTSGGDMAVCKETRKKENFAHQAKHNIVLSQTQAQKTFLIGDWYFGEVWNKLFRWEKVSDIRFDESLHVAEDIDFVWRVLQRVETAVFIPAERYYYRYNPDGLTHRFLAKQYQDICAVLTNIENTLSDKQEELKRLVRVQYTLKNIQSFLNLKSQLNAPKEIERELIQTIIARRGVWKQAQAFSKTIQMMLLVFGINPTLGYQLYRLRKKLRPREGEQR